MGIDVRLTVTGNGQTTCDLSDRQVRGIQDRAEPILDAAINQSVGLLPIEASTFRKSVVKSLLTKDNICQALNPPGNGETKSPAEFRIEFKGKSVKPENARLHGVVAERIPLPVQTCRSEYLPDSSAYIDVATCQDAAKIIAGKSPGAALYATSLPSDIAKAVFSGLRFARQLNDYSEEPKECNVNSEFHPFDAVVDFSIIIQNSSGPHWLAWKLASSCNDAEGREYTANDLKFSFGARVFVPVEVDAAGSTEENTLILNVAAAESNMWGSGVVSDQTLYEHFVGAAVTARYLLAEEEMKMAGKEAKLSLK
ncbi:MAG: hypothetical protein HY540_01650 [Deltaproteobacteria bacterium]|nr:hypothetical protein [Deltaproteobacteria bacterium]